MDPYALERYPPFRDERSRVLWRRGEMAGGRLKNISSLAKRPPQAYYLSSLSPSIIIIIITCVPIPFPTSFPSVNGMKKKCTYVLVASFSSSKTDPFAVIHPSYLSFFACFASPTPSPGLSLSRLSLFPR